MDSQSLVVVRGNRQGLDPSYACLSHNGEQGNYALLTFRDGQLVSRDVVPFADRARVEDYTLRDGFRGTVYVDERNDARLLPLRWSKKCESADLSVFRRAKSDVEIEALCGLTATTRDLLERESNGKDGTFRGVERDSGLKSAFQRTETPGFVQYRGGVKDELGRMTDLTRIVPKTEEWEARLQRVYRGLARVEDLIAPGVALAAVNDAFLECIDPTKDVVYGDAIHHTGFEGHENMVPLERLEEFDYLKLGVAVGDLQSKNDVALVYTQTLPVASHKTKEVDFRGTVIADRPVAVLKQLDTHKQGFASIIAERTDDSTAVATDNMQRELVRSLCDTTQNAGKTFGESIDAWFRGAEDATQETVAALASVGAGASGSEAIVDEIDGDWAPVPERGEDARRSLRR